MVFEEMAAYARGTVLNDGAGRYLGVVNSAYETDHLGGQPEPVQFGPKMLYPDHKSLPVEDAPDIFWRCLVYLEDRHRNTWDNPWGISLRALLRIPVSAARESLRSGRPALGAGGSTLEMQLARSFWKRYPGRGDTASRKLAEWLAAPVLKRRLTNGGDERRLRAWIAQHIALIQAAGGRYDVFGVEAAGRLLFGKSADELDAAEQILLAAFARSPLRLRADPESQKRLIRSLIGSPEYPGRAYICASDRAVLHTGGAVIENEDERAAANHRLYQWTQDPPQPVVDPHLRPFILPLLRHQAGPRLHPERLSTTLAKDVQESVIAQLADEIGQPWRGQVSRLNLTIDIAKNLAFAEHVNEVIRDIEYALPDHAFRPTPSLVVAAADEHGRIVRFINTSNDTLYNGAAAQRDNNSWAGQGRYDHRLEQRSIGSIGKIASALLLAESGQIDPEKVISNKCLPGLYSNCMGPDGRGDYPRVKVRDAFSRSLNSAITRYLAGSVDGSRIISFMERLDLNLPDNSRGNPPAINVTLGHYAGTPSNVQRLMEVALAYSSGKFNAVIMQPTLIDSYQRFDHKSDRLVGTIAGWPNRTAPMASFMRPGNAAGAAFVQAVLGAPLCDAKQGTLRRLYRWCARVNPAVRLHIAKTGTKGTGAQLGLNEYDWWIAGAIMFSDKRQYTYVVTLGTGASNTPFARDIGAGRLAPVIDVLLRDLQDDGVTPGHD